MVASPAYALDALLPTQVADIAKSTVVQIEPTVNSPGSGVMIGRYKEQGKNVYVVLTAAHVVQYLDDEYQIVTPLPQDGKKQRQKIAISTRKDIQKLPGVDLAIVRFRSDRTYQTATIGDSNYTTEGASVYIAGFPQPGAAIKKRVFQFTSSLVSSRLDGDTVEGEKEVVENGYAIVYTNVTRVGMSGSPIFDVSGRVVGIHGKGDREERGSHSSLLASKTGFNLGIPSQTFLKLVSNATQKLGVKYDSSQPGVSNTTITVRSRRNSSSPAPSPINIRKEDNTTVESVQTPSPIGNSW
ncbi:trypsin-like peptidase domain-containing protein [Iningainema sp. BLCCT55]|uniref:Trypsin-like peptidase domain-containing protein n=1 Tax=Iningainema tapete BLCC-T55 TaxID=2748662 RepID=A0A8J6XXE7_9CYAN|nr:trypsin-like peptidase domain-containing protein [Iningainema tapete BLCC-T55]